MQKNWTENLVNAGLWFNPLRAREPQRPDLPTESASEGNLERPARSGGSSQVAGR